MAVETRATATLRRVRRALHPGDARGRARGSRAHLRRGPGATPSSTRELDYLLKHYVGRPTPLYFAERLTRECGGARIWLKREDLAHTGAHKINNALGQALLAKRIGKPRIIAETGAGQHGVATATVCAMLDLECVVYMGSEDIKRQSLNVFRMKMLGATLVSVESAARRSRTPSTRRCATG